VPGHVDRTLLEVIAEGPVAQHFKKGVVVHILADVVQIVVLAPRADALLAVDRALQLAHLQVRIARA
jgi:hypothetical protein